MKTIIKILALVALVMVLIPTSRAETTKSSEPAEKLYTFLVPDSFDNANYPTWGKIIVRLRTLEKGDVVHLVVQGYGGQVLMLNEVRAAILWAKASGATVVATVIGPAYSAHASLVCFMDEVYYLPGSSLMFHYAATTEEKLFGLLEYRQLVTRLSDVILADSMLQDCVDKKILVPGQVKVVKGGKAVVVWREGKKLVSKITEDEGSEAEADRTIYKGLVVLSLLIIIIAILRLQRLNSIK